MSDNGADRWPLAAIVSLAGGICVWVGFSLAGGVREAWDTAAWWSLGLPSLAIVSGFAGYLSPVRVWRWPLFITGGQLLAIIAVAATGPNGADFGLLPLALVFVMLPLVIASVRNAEFNFDKEDTNA